MSEAVTPQTEDFSRWYTDVIQKADLADYSPVRGCMVIKPYGYSLWEHIHDALDRRFKETGHENAYFPMFIPMSFLQKEAEHVEGFSPELAVVTIGGGEKLEEPLVVRPTSETIIGHMYAQWIKSYRDLPVLINQWANVVRWEMRTRLFLRTAEFLWQEGHTAHATSEEAVEETLRMLDVYVDFAQNEAAIPVIPGMKSDSEKFAGAVNSYTIEAMMGDRRALQSGTSHYMGQNFSKAFDIDYLDQNNELQLCWTTSWGVSTRMIGAIIMTHGDDKGLVMPPRLAPIQAVVVPIYRTDEEQVAVFAAAEDICKRLKAAGIRVKFDSRTEMTPGWKYNDWEMRGVPLRIEVGPKDVAKQSVVFARRDIPGRDGKSFVDWVDLEAETPKMLAAIQQAMFDKALAFREANTRYPETWEAFTAAIEDGFALSWWCGSAECEEKIRVETKASNRCIPLDQPGGTGKCVVCGKESDRKAVFAKAY